MFYIIVDENNKKTSRKRLLFQRTKNGVFGRGEFEERGREKEKGTQRLTEKWLFQVVGR